MKILYLVHGYPPLENAGTEQHTALLASSMTQQGHDVTVISATRQIGKLHGEILHEVVQGVCVYRIVNNIPGVALATGETRPELTTKVDHLIERVSPDIIHIQHLQFLSTDISLNVPTFWTLHDAWGWCPAGGTLLLPDGSPCTEPTPSQCIKCSADWFPRPSPVGQRLLQIAGKLSPWIATDDLHKVWSLLPKSLRSNISRDTAIQDVESHSNLEYRNGQFTQLASKCQTLITPSRYLSHQASKQGWPTPIVIPHGVEPVHEKHTGGSGLIYIGSMVVHKGPSIIEQAYLEAFPNRERLIQFVGDGPVEVSLPHRKSVKRTEVFKLLKDADALVMGSIWPENAPMIILEARAIGCPIIAPSIGGIPEIIEHGIDGLLYTPNDIESLASAMHKVYEQSWTVTPPRTISRMIADYEHIYQQSLK